jgi:hypothetical protein
MLDVTLYLLGAILFVGQAVYFLLFTGDWTVPAWSDRSMTPALGPDWAGTYEGSEMGAHQL